MNLSLSKRIGNLVWRELRMNSYIFISSEGYTYQPGSASDNPDVENLQVIGFASGEDERAAFENLIAENGWLSSTSFGELKCFQMKHRRYEKHEWFFNLKS